MGILYDRYIHIKDPLRYSRWMTKRVIYCSIATIWLLAALISFMPVSLDLHKPQSSSDDSFELIDERSRNQTYHSENSPETQLLDHYPQCVLDLTPTYAIVSSCISFCFPCIVMLVKTILCH